jgi:hypothetical protein
MATKLGFVYYWCSDHWFGICKSCSFGIFDYCRSTKSCFFGSCKHYHARFRLPFIPLGYFANLCILAQNGNHKRTLRNLKISNTKIFIQLNTFIMFVTGVLHVGHLWLGCELQSAAQSAQYDECPQGMRTNS